MRIPLPQPPDLAAAPTLAALSVLEVALVLASDVLHPASSPPWLDLSDYDGVRNARVLAHECLHLRRLLASYRSRLLRNLRRQQKCIDNLF